MKAEIIKPSTASEPSEPSEIRPEKKSREQLRGAQEENPQMLAHRKGKQSGDAKARASKKEDEGDEVAQQGFAGKGYTGQYGGPKSKL